MVSICTLHNIFLDVAGPGDYIPPAVNDPSPLEIILERFVMSGAILIIPAVIALGVCLMVVLKGKKKT